MLKSKIAADIRASVGEAVERGLELAAAGEVVLRRSARAFVLDLYRHGEGIGESSGWRKTDRPPGDVRSEVPNPSGGWTWLHARGTEIAASCRAARSASGKSSS